MDQIIQFANSHVMLAVSAVAVTLMALIYEIRLKTQGFREIAAADSVRLINQGAIVLDLRKREQFNAGHIINARNIEADQLDTKLGDLKNNLEQPIVVCCDSGVSSSRVAASLHKQGFTQVYNLKGGLAAWRNENYPLESKGAQRKGK
ncbi:MAG: rhodanese-like domain-containing protein [Gammaproteobacteria bacterium]|nr:rhodanese-like domain-containing protein [Gammaproteobacteria bacterium]